MYWLACPSRVWYNINNGFHSWSDQTKTVTLVFAGSPSNTWHCGAKGKDIIFKVRITCPSGAKYLPADCCFSKLALYESN